MATGWRSGSWIMGGAGKGERELMGGERKSGGGRQLGTWSRRAQPAQSIGTRPRDLLPLTHCSFIVHCQSIRPLIFQTLTPGHLPLLSPQHRIAPTPPPDQPNPTGRRRSLCPPLHAPPPLPVGSQIQPTPRPISHGRNGICGVDVGGAGRRDTAVDGVA